MNEEKTREQKINWLQDNINYACYKKMLDNGFTDEMFEELYEEMQETNYCGGDLRIVSEPLGELETDSKIKSWVHQTRNGGYTGDDFAGDIYIKINDREYITYGYWM